MYVCMYVQWDAVDLGPPPPPLFTDTPHANAKVQVHQTNSRAVSLKIILASVADECAKSRASRALTRPSRA